MSSNKGGGAGSSEIKPYKAFKPAIDTLGKDIFSQYQTQGTPDYFPGQTVAPFSPETQQGLAAQFTRGQAGNPLNQQAQQYASNAMAGNFMANPSMGNIQDMVNRNVGSGIDSQFESGGRYGSGMHAGMRAEGLAAALAPYEYQDYQNKLGLQQQAAGAAPGLANQDYTDISAQLAAGQAQDLQSQREIAGDVERFNYGENADVDYMQKLMAGYFQSPYNQQQAGSTANPLFGGLGGAAMGAAAFPANPFLGALGGGLLGGVGSIF
jgi:hypothetical protein